MGELCERERSALQELCRATMLVLVFKPACGLYILIQHWGDRNVRRQSVGLGRAETPLCLEQMHHRRAEMVSMV